jgi:DNA helicase-2/ATP-dependent DNA helicase PcrA
VKRSRPVSRFFTEVPDKHCVTRPISDPTRRKKTEPQPSNENVQFPTSYSELSYYISCSYDYKMRFIFGFNPGLVQALGYGRQVHNIINLLHKRAQETGKLPTFEDAERLVERNFYLRYAAASQTEPLKKGALKCVKNYLSLWKQDFSLSVKTERTFEMDVENALISGSIDLLKRGENAQEDVLEIIDFKTGKHRIECEEMERQVQLYTYAAKEALNLDVRKAYLHFLDDEKAQRYEILTTRKQLELAMETISQTVKGVTHRSFERDPKSKRVCSICDWNKICPQLKR